MPTGVGAVRSCFRGSGGFPPRASVQSVGSALCMSIRTDSPAAGEMQGQSKSHWRQETQAAGAGAAAASPGPRAVWAGRRETLVTQSCWRLDTPAAVVVAMAAAAVASPGPPAVVPGDA